MASPSRRRADLASEATRLLFHLALGHRDRFIEVAVSLGLTPPHVNALLTLDPERAQPMRDLAQQWRCDASNVTWLVDRLEERGLVERRTDPSDRRVRAIALTAAGVEAKAEAERRMQNTPLPALDGLDASELTQLVRLLGRLDLPDPSRPTAPLVVGRPPRHQGAC